MLQYRRKTAASLGSLTLVAALTGVATTAATAAAATCQGQAATIVSSDAVITGTEGADVIVAGPTGAEIRGLGGDDLICVVSTLGHSFAIDAGAGDDVVDTTGVTGGGEGIRVILGAGADKFLGGAADETVVADVAGSAEDDVIDTGAGADHVDSGTDGYANKDVITLGAGDDHVRLRATRFTGEVDGGAGSTELTVGDADGKFTVDATTGLIQRNGEDWSKWKGQFQRFQVPATAGLTFKGSDLPEHLALGDQASMNVDLAGGDDELVLSAAPRKDDVVDGGAGRDRITVRVAGAGTELDLDLASGAFESTIPPAGPAASKAANFEDAYLKGHKLTLRGTPEANDLSLTGCEMVAKGGAGDDSLTAGPDVESDERTIPDCPKPTARFDGGAGEDTIQGSDGEDSLRGGPGDDKIWGGAGHDEIWGGNGHDMIRGGNNADKIWGGNGRDDIRGNNGHDQIWGGKGRDTLEGGRGRDQLWGNQGNDLLKGQKHNDELWGGWGQDEARGGPGRDRCDAEKKRGCER